MIRCPLSLLFLIKSFSEIEMLNRNLEIIFAILWFFHNQPSADLLPKIAILKIFYLKFHIHSFLIVYTRILVVPREAITQIIVV